MTSLKQISNTFGSVVVNINYDHAIISIAYENEVAYFQKHVDAINNIKYNKFVTDTCTTYVMNSHDFMKDFAFNWGIRVCVRNTYFTIVTDHPNKISMANTLSTIKFSDGKRFSLIECDNIIAPYDTIKDAFVTTLDLGWYPVG
jgi:hypothetical protein